ncbi:MAG: hypothetical protein HOY71_51345 [Nonomuraea sp.]|nr:hypothetical protein [Nonomuraea sp.]
MTGDVLSPRWSTEDTDEQPAIQVSGNETYILPAGQGAPQLLDPPPGLASVPDDVPPGASGPHSVLGGASGPHDVLGGLGSVSGPHDVLGGDSGPHAVGVGNAFDTAAEGSGRDLHDTQAEEELPYLPLDQGYEPAGDDGPDRTRRGFLGSGWTEDTGDDGRSGGSGRSGGRYGGSGGFEGDREVRRRTRVLVAAAAAVVLVGVRRPLRGWPLRQRG